MLDIPPVDGAPMARTSGVLDGATGALFLVGGNSYNWLDYGSGAVTPVTLPGKVDDLLKADGDQVGLWDGSKGLLQVGAPLSGTWTSYAIPTGLSPVAVHGSEVLVFVDGQGTYQLLAYDAQGGSTQIPLKGLPADAGNFSMRAGPAGIAIGFVTSDQVAHWGLADWATGTYHELRSAAGGYPNGISITGDHAVVFAPDPHGTRAASTKLYVYPVSQVLAGAAVTPRTPTADISYFRPVQVVGDHLLYFDYSQLTDLPLDGGSPKVLDTNAFAWLYGSGDDLMVASSAPSDHWQNRYSVEKYTAAADGSLTTHTIYSPYVPPSHLASLWMVAGELGYGRDWAGSGVTTVHVTAGSDDVSSYVGQLAPGWAPPASGSHLPAGTLVQTQDGKQVRTINTGAGCTPVDWQVSQHWLYWNCGATAPSGIYDLDTNRTIGLPSSAPYMSRVGDGYLVNQDPATGHLLLTDFHDGTITAPVVIATARVASSDGMPGSSWAVDPRSGYVAYEDAANRVLRVIDPGIPRSPVTASMGAFSGTGGPDLGNVSVVVSQPVDGWRATVVRRSTGQVMARLSGGPAHAWFGVHWTGSQPYNGAYDWSISVLPHGGTTYAPVGSTTDEIFDGRPDRHVYGFGDHPDLLALRTSSGGSVWWTLNNSGHITPAQTAACQFPGGTEVWLPFRSFIPIGHQAGTGANDLLALDGYGNLWWYPNASSYDTCPEKSFAQRVGGGWGQYTAVVSPGDLNGDGHDDLVARDTHGTSWFYAGRGKGQFAPRVRIGGGWGGYTRLIGAGDLTGSGYGDLLAVDRSGVMWRFDGNGRGGFRSRARVGGGWGSFNAVIGIGDWNQNGTYDLIARDRKGALWVFDGTGRGSFRAGTKIGTGFGQYWGLF